ncbi:hypothetical protein RAS1_42650 [Phycisphaerae bacterium RAS1]|nr:hypothetical protein RAS1_42650 [Phycisphaerae bacterium RAS1]
MAPASHGASTHGAHQRLVPGIVHERGRFGGHQPGLLHHLRQSVSHHSTHDVPAHIDGLHGHHGHSLGSRFGYYSTYYPYSSAYYPYSSAYYPYSSAYYAPYVLPVYGGSTYGYPSGYVDPSYIDPSYIDPRYIQPPLVEEPYFEPPYDGSIVLPADEPGTYLPQAQPPRIPDGVALARPLVHAPQAPEVLPSETQRPAPEQPQDDDDPATPHSHDHEPDRSGP